MGGFHSSEIVKRSAGEFGGWYWWMDIGTFQNHAAEVQPLGEAGQFNEVLSVRTYIYLCGHKNYSTCCMTNRQTDTQTFPFDLAPNSFSIFSPFWAKEEEGFFTFSSKSSNVNFSTVSFWGALPNGSRLGNENLPGPEIDFWESHNIIFVNKILGHKDSGRRSQSFFLLSPWKKMAKDVQFFEWPVIPTNSLDLSFILRGYWLIGKYICFINFILISFLLC